MTAPRAGCTMRMPDAPLALGRRKYLLYYLPSARQPVISGKSFYVCCRDAIENVQNREFL